MSKLLFGGVLLLGAATTLHPVADRPYEAAAVAAAEARVAVRYCGARFNNAQDRASCLASFGLPPQLTAMAEIGPDEDVR